MSLYGESGYEICHILAGTLIFKFLTIPDWLKFKTHGCKLLESIVFASGYVGLLFFLLDFWPLFC